MPRNDKSPPLPWRPLRRAILRPPSQQKSDAIVWAEWGYSRPRNLAQAVLEHEAFCNHLRQEGVSVHLLNASVLGDVDACYVCDPAIMTANGAILLRAGKVLRRNEVQALPSLLETLDVPVVASIQEPGTVDGGDCVWLDEQTLAIGTGFRSNAAGIDQLAALLPEVTILPIPLPSDGGPEACFHLGSIVSLLDSHLALVHESLAPTLLLDALRARGFECLPCPPEEFDNQACNVLCTGPSRIVLARGNPRTSALLQRHGVQVTSLSGEEIMILGTGGPTCLVLGVERA